MKMQGSLFAKTDDDSLLVEMQDGSVEAITKGSDYWMRSTRISDYETRSKGLWYHSKSGLHKELRTGNFTRAWSWAQLVERVRKGAAKQYLRGIWGEEVGNLDLMGRFYDGTGLKELVRLFCASVKDWDIEVDRGIFSPHWYSYAAKNEWHWRVVNAERDPAYDYPPDVAAFVSQCVKSDDMEKLYELLVMTTCWTPTANRIIRQVRGAMVDEAVKVLGDKYGFILGKMRANYHAEEVLRLWQVVAGQFPIEYCEYGTVKRGPEMDIPWLQEYVLDSHTRTGKSRIAKHGRRLDWGKPMVGRIDLRMSGGSAGTLWRYLAKKQHGSIMVPWESVAIPDQALEDYAACCDGVG